MAGYGIITVNLIRDGFNTPWGFRLSGGKDFKTQLIVTKVATGSPADTELHTGDVILNLENYDTRNMLHKKAQEIIKNCGGSMCLKVQRTGASNVPARTSVTSPIQQYLDPSGQTPQGFRSRPLDSSVGVVGFIPKLKSPPSSSAQMDYGTDFTTRVSPRPISGSAPQGFMINKINDTLSNAIWQAPSQAAPQPQAPAPRVVSGLMNNDSVIRQSKRSPVSQSWSGNQAWKKPVALDMPGGLMEPGWTPYKNQKQPIRKVQSPGVAKGPIISERSRIPQEAPAHIPYEEPAWKNSLRSSSRPNDYIIPTQVINSNDTPVIDDAPPVEPHQPHVQQFITKPDGSVQYSTSPTPDEAENAQVKHLQFNSPLNLYSKGNAQQVLEGQTAGKPGEGTLNLGGGSNSNPEINFKNSHLALMIQQEEWEKKMRNSRSPLRDMPPAVSSNYSKPHQSNNNLSVNDVEQCRQSPSMYALESQMGNTSIPKTDGGFSDF